MSKTDGFDQQALRLSALAVWLAVAAAAYGQAAPNIPNEIRTAASITGDQRATIDAFVAYWVGALAGEGEKTIPEAQDQIVEKFAAPASAAFRQAYSEALGPALTPLGENPDVQARLAAMIVGSHFSTGAGADLYNRGLKDANVGVRYHAAKAIADVMGRGAAGQPAPLAEPQQRTLLATLTEAMPKEAAAPVFQQMGRALSSLSIPQAFDQAVGVLRGRVAWQRQNPAAPPIAAREIMENLLARLSQFEAAGGNVEQRVRDLTTVAGLQLRVLTEVIRAGGGGAPAGEAETAWAGLLETIETRVFSRAIQSLAPGTEGPSLTAPLKKNSWADVSVNISKWIGGENPGILTTALNIPLADLQLPPLPEQPGPAAEPAAGAARGGNAPAGGGDNPM